jgi:hypothetical protein
VEQQFTEKMDTRFRGYDNLKTKKANCKKQKDHPVAIRRQEALTNSRLSLCLLLQQQKQR